MLLDNWMINGGTILHVGSQFSWSFFSWILNMGKRLPTKSFHHIWVYSSFKAVLSTYFSKRITSFFLCLSGRLMRCQYPSSNCEGGLRWHHLHALPAAPCYNVQQVNQTLMTECKREKNIWRAFRWQQRHSVLGSGACIDQLQLAPVLRGVAEIRYLADSSHNSSSVMKARTSPTRQRIQMHATVLIVTPGAYGALLFSPFDSQLLIMCLK